MCKKVLKTLVERWKKLFLHPNKNIRARKILRGNYGLINKLTNEIILKQA